ncbi:WYL domain-containing protein [Streptomyces sp. NPDC048419]|uniref:WYL domain-containing protein n=1 Tax=Streptomyces sp. NPDC048419 TaxID=3365547 RepID=UPI00371D4431
MTALPASHRPDADRMSRLILIDLVRWGGTPAIRCAAVDLAAFQQAVFADRRVRLRYRHGRYNRVRVYALDPYGLANKAGVCYLVADHQGEPSLFRTDRAQTATVLTAPPAAARTPNWADVWEYLRRSIDDIPTPLAVTVRVRDHTLALFPARSQSRPRPLPQKRSRTAGAHEGWTEVDLLFQLLFGATAHLAFGPALEVLAPDDLRQRGLCGPPLWLRRSGGPRRRCG